MGVRQLLGHDLQSLRRYFPEAVAVTIALSAVPLIAVSDKNPDFREGIAGVVPPNRLYGFRTPTTLASPDVWYPANLLMGWYMLGSQVLAIASLNAVSERMRSRFGRDRATWGVLWPCVTALAGIGACAIHYTTFS